MDDKAKVIDFQAFKDRINSINRSNGKPDLDERIARIKTSIERINQLMYELRRDGDKKREKEGE